MRSPDALPNRLLVAIGGNATHPDGIRGTVQEQNDLAAKTGKSLLPLMKRGSELVDHAWQRAGRRQDLDAAERGAGPHAADDARYLRRAQPGRHRAIS